ncbi:MAG: Ribosomal small subunit methyltransferase [Gemmatimonadetes bacterium]|nr:Ribosomal small subunit methyltransferase [Gemmatimonadota bacterium]
MRDDNLAVGDRWDSEYHAPVLATEVLALLEGCQSVLDGTLGGGGHSQALLEAGKRVIALDRDPQAITVANGRLASWQREGQFQAVEGNYAGTNHLPALAGVTFDGILLDLGISSHQVDDSARGFSFREGAPLDMRMGSDADRDAAQLLNEASEEEIVHLFRSYGDEPKAARLAHEVVRRRANRPFLTSDDLVGAIRGALGARSGAGDFARLFQAVRIAVNEELTGLERALPMLRDRLAPGGVMAVIAYHSGEDRLVKHAFRDWSQACTCPPKQPFCNCGSDHALGAVITRRAIIAQPHETARNPRARSARLRGWRRNAA